MLVGIRTHTRRFDMHSTGWYTCGGVFELEMGAAREPDRTAGQGEPCVLQHPEASVISLEDFNQFRPAKALRAKPANALTTV